MDKPDFGYYINPNGHEREVGAVAIVNPDGTAIARNDLGLTPFEAKVIRTLCEIRDRLPEPPKPAAPVAAKPTVSAKSQPKD